MSENTPQDPILNAAFNAALEWAANWITGPQMEGHSAEVIEFAKNMAMSLRAGKREAGFQQDFFDAVRSDPYMPVAEKEFWLSQEVRPTPRALDGLTVCEKCGGWLKGGECENCNSPLAARQ